MACTVCFKSIWSYCANPFDIHPQFYALSPIAPSGKRGILCFETHFLSHSFIIFYYIIFFLQKKSMRKKKKEKKVPLGPFYIFFRIRLENNNVL